MKIFTGTIAALAASVVNGVNLNADIYYHKKEPLGPSMWHFSGDGVTIYSPDGSKVLKAHPKKSVCKPYMSYRGTMSEDCYFFTTASDGHKYVWAGTLAGVHRVEAFDIDSGEYVGYNPTCSTPLDLEYHPTRQEMWLRCAQSDFKNGHEGEIDVFSSSSLSSDFDHIYLNETYRPYGRIAIHSTMGTYGYVAAYDQDELIELDLSSKTVHARYPVENIQGMYDMTYSPVNRHVYARTRVCCACGFDGADYAECGGRVRKVDVKTGPNAGMMQVNGTCGSGCEGTTADTIGVIEFDTLNKVMVGEHNIREATGFGSDPVASPDGKYVLLLPNDAGAYVRIIEPGANGVKSKVIHDVPTAFEGGTAGRSVASDYAFVQDEKRNILILGASTDNNVVIVDLDDADFKMRKLALTAEVESTGGSSRKLEWAVGTDYVWVDGGDAKQQYVLEVPSGDIADVRLIRTLDGIRGGNMMFVNNYERQREEEKMASMIADAAAAVTADKSESSESASASSSEEEVATVVEKSSSSSSEEGEDATVVGAEAAEATVVEESSDTIGVVALIVACVALLLGVALAGVQFTASKAVPKDTDTQSLGSKNIA